MKRNKLVLVLLAMIMLMGVFVGCNKNSAEAPKEKEEEVVVEETTEESAEEESSHYPVTITTYNLENEPIELTFEKAPEKVLAVYQSSIDNMLALGLADKMIGAAALDVPVKDDVKADFEKVEYFEQAPSKEAVLDMEPDFIISWYSYFMDQNLGNVEFWHDRNINTYIQLNSGIMQPNKLEYEYEDILNLGKIFDKEAEAQAIVDQMKAEIEEAKDYAKDKEKVKTVILEVGKENSFRNYGGDSIGGDIAQLVGADLVIPLNGKFGVEELVEADPDVIFTVYYSDAITTEEAVKDIVENPALQSLSAIQNDRVGAIMLSEVYASGVRTADGIKTIIKGLYPELDK